ncbi:MAG: cyclodeaminase/cyclohydrolase family protein [Elusimicrobiota bacterium]|jgi:formiminotetrahydrofolate cyclodeaminase|nr:cyclodeaminase/cyclohydrolase family protein [Elusimicrobiota bacterium]
MKHVNWETSAGNFVDAVASASATPGGGSASAVMAAAGCGLCMMAANITIKNKSTSEEDKKILNAALDALFDIKETLKAGAAADAEAYEKVVSARKLPKESRARAALLDEALQAAALVPLETARRAREAVQKAGEIEGKIWPVIMSDIVCGKIMLEAAITCLAQNVKANLPYIKDKNFKASLMAAVAEAVKK